MKLPPLSSAYHQQTDAEATRRSRKYHPDLADKQKLELKRKAEKRQRNLDAEARLGVSKTGQGH